MSDPDIFRDMFEAHPAPTWVWDLETLRFLAVNEAAIRQYGYSREEFAALTMSDIRPPSERSRFHALWRSAARNYRGEWLHRRKNGSTLVVDLLSEAVVYDGRSARLACAIDISEQKRAEAALDDSQRLLNATFENAGIAMTVVDLDRRPIRVNAEMLHAFGYSAAEFAALSFRDVTHPDDREDDDPRWAALASGSIDRYAAEKRYIRKDGRELVGRLTATLVRDASGQPSYAIGAIVDITEFRTLEAQFHQAQKLEAVGRLAGGVAHDFNNLLTAIVGYTELVIDELPLGSPLREDLAQVLTASHSARTLTRQLLAFSRRGQMHTAVLDLNVVVSNLEKVLGRVIGDDVSVTVEAGAGLRSIEADPGYVEQVLMNLAVNARDAMPQGGQLTVTTANVDIDRAIARGRPDVAPGPYVMLAVADTGTGMTREVMSKIFEPFFTTKEPGKGTGLGLATVYGIVTRSGGFLDVQSEWGRGTTFRAYFPMAAGAAGGDQAGRPAGESRGGSEIVLLAEDDERLRALATRVLERHGYTVVATGSGEDALVADAAQAVAIDLLFTDIVMPGVDGRTLALRLRKKRPGLHVLYTTGDPDRMSGMDEPGHFLQKPYTGAALLNAVRRALDA